MAEATVAEQDEAAAAAEQDDDFFDTAKQDVDGGEDGGGEEPRNGNGKRTLADLAAEAPDADGSTEADDDGEQQPQLFGTERKVTASVKGPKPKSSHVSFTTAEVEVDGQFHPEDLIEVRATLELGEVAIKYRRKAGAIVDTRRVHKAKAIRVEQLNLPAELLRARLEFVASELGVDPDALASAQERAVTEVTLGE